MSLYCYFKNVYEKVLFLFEILKAMLPIYIPNPVLFTMCFTTAVPFNYSIILRPRHNGRHFPDDIFKCVSLNENMQISIKIPLKFVPTGPINNIPVLF